MAGGGCVVCGAHEGCVGRAGCAARARRGDRAAVTWAEATRLTRREPRPTSLAPAPRTRLGMTYQRLKHYYLWVKKT